MYPRSRRGSVCEWKVKKCTVMRRLEAIGYESKSAKITIYGKNKYLKKTTKVVEVGSVFSLMPSPLSLVTAN